MAALVERVRVERAVGGHGRRVRQLDPHLDPRLLAREEAFDARLDGTAPAVGVSERPRFIGRNHANGMKMFSGAAAWFCVRS